MRVRHNDLVTYLDQMTNDQFPMTNDGSGGRRGLRPGESPTRREGPLAEPDGSLSRRLARRGSRQLNNQLAAGSGQLAVGKRQMAGQCAKR